MCATKALLAGDANVISDIYRERIINRGASVLNRGVSYQNAAFRASRGMEGKSSIKK
jgi:formate dehydrogenase iron-sulfur subunit